MITLYETAYGKLNLTLDVLGRRPDGYHDLEMVMISVSLADRLTLELGGGGDWAVTCNRPGIPQGPENLCWRAAEVYCRAAGVDPAGLRIHIQKEIPAQAGMAGGSSDAAAVLRALNRHYGAFDEERLRALGLTVGSDVPYCLFGGAALARGRGEVLTRLPALPEDLCFVLVKPDFAVSTPSLFREIDAQGVQARPAPDPAFRGAQCAPAEASGTRYPCRGAQCAPAAPASADAMLRAIEAQNPCAIGAALQNAFEPLVAARYPVVEALRRSLLSCGALGARLTGTGSVVYGLFSSKYRAAAAALFLREQYPEVHLVTPV